MLDCKPHGMWWDWESLGRWKEPVVVGLSTRGQHATEGMWASPVRTGDGAACSLPCISGFQLFDSPLLPEAILTETVSSTPLAESGWEGKRDGGAPRGLFWGQKGIPVELSSGFRLKLGNDHDPPALRPQPRRTAADLDISLTLPTHDTMPALRRLEIPRNHLASLLLDSPSHPTSTHILAFLPNQLLFILCDPGVTLLWGVFQLTHGPVSALPRLP